jgi:lysozyme
MRHEGYSRAPYRCPAGFWTIGYGHKLSSDPNMTEEDALRLSGGPWEPARAKTVLRDDIKLYSDGVVMSAPWVADLDQVRKDALFNMAFNLGVTGLMKFKRMMAALRQGDYNLAADEAMGSKWAFQVKSRAKELAAQIRTGVRAA